MGNTFRKSEFLGHQLEMEFAEAAWAGDLSRILELVKQVDEADKQEALGKAAGMGHLDVVRYLAEHCGADVNAKARYGGTALMGAARSGKIDIVLYLTERFDADVNAANNEGDTALMLACRNGHVQVARYLAEQCGADVNAKNNDEKTAIRLAVDSGNLEIQRILMPLLRPTTAPLHAPAGAISMSFSSLSSCLVSPSEIELAQFCHSSSVGGDFRAKWLDADVVVKIFIPDASHLPFEDEVRLWQQLRHPNVLKMYGACVADPHLQFFVCEYASQGSLLEHVTSSVEKKPVIWKYLYEGALGLGYLHERRIVHGDLRCSNILISSDGAAKLSNFGLSGSMKKSNQVRSCLGGSIHWQAPEVILGEPPSYASDVYSLGMCVLEAATGKMPWSNKAEYVGNRICKTRWTPETNVSSDNDPDCPTGDVHDLVWHICAQDPRKRPSLSSLIYELEVLAINEHYEILEPENEPVSGPTRSQQKLKLQTFDEYERGKLSAAWMKLQAYMDKSTNAHHHRAFGELKKLKRRLQQSTHHPTLFARLYALLTEFRQMIKVPPEQARVMRLSSTRATSRSLYAIQWRIKSLIASLEGTEQLARKREALWQQQHSEIVDFFVSGVSDTFLLLKDLKSVEERAAFLKTLRTEIQSPRGNYTPHQLDVMKKAYGEIASKLKTGDLKQLTPEWFIPWYELIVDEWGCLGEGGFGSVYRAKWLDSDVVVKRVTLAGSDSDIDLWATMSSLSISEDPSAAEILLNSFKRAEARAMFRREVEIWFGFSHPHVIRLFGACHVGRPFFVCEYATHGTLVSYLLKHPEDLWAKLHEAALGVQYLHARDVVHGDLKGNNIVIGRDKKAKVTDFGLSSAASSDEKPAISGAWHWVAPECLLGLDKRPTFASDIYALGMCIVEAMRVVEAAISGKTSHHCLPWCLVDRAAVSYHATHGKLPSRPTICENMHWELVERMCVLDPKGRIKISTVVDELARLATSGQNNDRTDLAHVLSLHAARWGPVHEVIAAAQQHVSQIQSEASVPEGVFSLYSMLWRKLERVYDQINNSFQMSTRHAAFYSLIVSAEVATTKLRENKGSLISIAQTVMRCHALDRKLDKFCEANLLGLVDCGHEGL